jgi:hypothetical protein
MTEPKQVRSWIEQAEADLAAARTRGDGIAECHRRYWLQQSYEKAIKALALMKWTGGPRDETEFSKQFLLQHSPLKKVGATPTPLSKALRLLARELDAHVRRLDNGGILRQIDATTPTIDPAEVSYRYPFRRDGDFLAPASFEDWDLYQGNFMAAESAVRRLIGVVKDEFQLFARTPK